MNQDLRDHPGRRDLLAAEASLAHLVRQVVREKQECLVIEDPLVREESGDPGEKLVLLDK